ncbi:hypothetical protein M406DRAFT_59048 [Cryphonectria parasitica EP155]|uniref:Store-operated calcium entry-associated regulatory factor n=1 Tax=Cryphonectria parasitica (strain ATCC 38755 / EP155) TaxID=660469 RepID=A0A9P4YAN5_CRYP1|nr:uncharacterized protein M406DRAFT_59048 [Cryphonectria parasitica EP155]KAF3769876.1 hypothetical protein M406DRAFT_59048 [Cryphonectria parasitica EP155]
MTPSVFLILLLSVLPSPVAAATPRDAILLSHVESITLRADRQTSHRRVSAIPQLQCIASPGLCDKFPVDVMRCDNRGSGYDSEEIQWSCTAQLPPELKLGSTDVICEGYTSPDDPYVLKGSCGVEYRLALTPLGEEKWGRRPAAGNPYSHLDNPDTAGSRKDRLFVALFWIVFGAVALWIVYSLVQEMLAPNRPRAPRRITGGGGGGGGGVTEVWRQRHKEVDSSSRGGNWQSNILSGAAGAAAGYYAGSRARNNSSNAPAPSSSWFGSPGSSSGSGSGVSSSRYESTGFGSTSRR